MVMEGWWVVKSGDRWHAVDTDDTELRVDTMRSEALDEPSKR